MLVGKPLMKVSEVERMKCVYEILAYSADQYGERIAYRQPEGRKDESTISFQALREQVDCLRAALKADGCTGAHISIIGETSIEWISAYLAIVSGTGVCVPVDRELREETIITQLTQAHVETVFCSAKCWKKIAPLLSQCPELHRVILMRSETIPDEPALSVPMETFGCMVSRGRELLALKGEDALPREIDPDATCIIIFTSGTTGANKGVMLSNRNIMGTLRGCARLLKYPGSSFSVLPVNHSFELHAHLMSSLYCGTTVFLNDDLKHLMKNLQKSAPEMTCMVPMMLDMIMHRIRKEIQNSGQEEKFNKAATLSNRLRRVGIDRREELFADVRAPLGGRLKMIVCGGAALPQQTIDFFDTIGVEVYNGYGITECAPVAAVNPNRHRKKNSVGYILPTMKARIVDPDENGNGEILLSGENVMQGYYNDADSTGAVFSENGWFRTGDIGHMSRDGYLYITGRLKNLIILPNGKNISPEEIEDQLMRIIPGIKECVVTENDQHSGLYAIIYPDSDFCRNNCLVTVEDIDNYMTEQLKVFNQGAASFKRISDFELTDKEFEKSSTHKIQRFKIKKSKGADENV